MMKKNRLVFYSVFGVLHLFIFFSTLYVEYVGKHDIIKLFDLYKNIWMLKYGSILLLILFTTNVILHYRDNRRNLREKEQLNQELNTLKAKLYDLQEELKAKPVQENPTQ
jgi:hypothetical protein